MKYRKLFDVKNEHIGVCLFVLSNVSPVLAKGITTEARDGKIAI